jgi:outer membrane protein OmpA-like peptidoglycan-associated protein
MKGCKISAIILSVCLILSGCSMSNTAKGGLIGGGSGGALGALIGHLAGGGKGAAIGAAVGVAVGTGAGVLIGNKMDKAKKAAEAAKAEAELLQGSDGTQYVKATFASGLLFQTGSANLSASAKADINTFIANLKAEDDSYDIAICGFSDNQGWKNSTAAQSKVKNQELSMKRAQSVQTQFVAAGYPTMHIIHVNGYGEEHPVADNATSVGQEQNRRVEVYILPSKEMINAANAAATK